MFLVPAWAWRGGAIVRAVCVGVPVGIFLAALVFAGVRPHAGCGGRFRRDQHLLWDRDGPADEPFWPAAKDLSGGDRVAVVRAARRGEDIDDARLAPAALEYGSGLREAREQARRWKWMLWLGVAAVLVLAVLDSISGPPRTAAVSWLFVVFFAVEIFWWPRAQNRLLVNAERTGESARRALSQRQTGDA
jgi:hypothetical protein